MQATCHVSVLTGCEHFISYQLKCFMLHVAFKSYSHYNCPILSVRVQKLSLTVLQTCVCGGTWPICDAQTAGASELWPSVGRSLWHHGSAGGRREVKNTAITCSWLGTQIRVKIIYCAKLIILRIME